MQTRTIYVISAQLDHLREKFKNEGGQKRIAADSQIPETTLQLYKKSRLPRSSAPETISRLFEYLEKMDDHLIDSDDYDEFKIELELHKINCLSQGSTLFHEWVSNARQNSASDNTVAAGLAGVATGAAVGAFLGPIGSIIGAATAGIGGAFIGSPSVEKRKKLEEFETKFKTNIDAYITDLARYIEEITHHNKVLAQQKARLWAEASEILIEFKVSKSEIEKIDRIFKKIPDIESLTGISDFGKLSDLITKIRMQLKGE